MSFITYFVIFTSYNAKTISFNDKMHREGKSRRCYKNFKIANKNAAINLKKIATM